MSLDGMLHAYVAAIEGDRRTAVGVVFVDSLGRVRRRFGRSIPATKDRAAFRGVLYALWNSRRLGCRRVIVHSDNPAVVAQINGRREVDLDLVGPYLQVRALLHAYRSARVVGDQKAGAAEARAVAEAARGSGALDNIVVEDLPLWAWSRVDDRQGAPVP
jgi:hypothetical protein